MKLAFVVLNCRQGWEKSEARMSRSKKSRAKCVTWLNRQGNSINSNNNSQFPCSIIRHITITRTLFQLHARNCLLGLRKLLMKISTKSLLSSSALPNGSVSRLSYIFHTHACVCIYIIIYHVHYGSSTHIYILAKAWCKNFYWVSVSCANHMGL